MTAITIKPRNPKELKAVKDFFKTIDLPYYEENDTKMSKEAFFTMIEKRKKSVRKGNVVEYTDALKETLFKNIL